MDKFKGLAVIGAVAFVLFIAGCSGTKDIVKVIDFELSPDEERIAFAAVTPAGNSDIWVVDIDGTNLKKLTFKDRSPSNHFARFCRKYKRRNFFEIDMHSPLWTRDGRIAFAQELTQHHIFGVRTVDVRQWTINPDGSDKRQKTDEDEIVRRRPFSPIHSFEMSDTSEKHKKEISLKDGALWILDFGETRPKKLIQ